MSGPSWCSLHEKMLSLSVEGRECEDKAGCYDGLMTLLNAALNMRSSVSLAKTQEEAAAALQFQQLMRNVASGIVGAGGGVEETGEDCAPTMLYQIWQQIFSDYALKSKSLAVLRSVALFNGYRPLANFFGQKIGDIANGSLLPKQWLSAVTAVLLHVYSKSAIDDSAAQAAFCAIMETGTMPSDAHWALLQHMAHDNTFVVTTKIIDFLPAEWSFSSARLLMRHSRSSRDFFTKQQPSSAKLLHKLFAKAISALPINELVEEILLKKTYDSSNVCGVFISLLPGRCLPATMASISSLWGNRLFVSRGDDPMQEYLTTALLLCLKRCDNPVASLETAVNGGASIAVLLSEGIAVYFDANKKSSRLCGMRVARAFASAMGGEVEFDELKQFEMQAAAGQTAEQAAAEQTAAEQAAAEKSEVESVKVAVEAASRPRSPSDLSSSSSGGSDLEAYDIDDDGTATDTQQRTVSYLRSCLELIQTAESSPEAYENHRSGLASIPQVVAQRPLDGAIVCGSIVKELLRMPNAFNMADFAFMHSRALDVLFLSYPVQAISAVSLALEGEVLSVGGRLTAICAAVRAALSLSGLEKEGEKEGGKEGVLGDEGERATAELATLAALKTKVRRPAMLLQRGKKQRYFRNGFAPVAATFFAAISGVLNRHSRRHTGGGGGGGGGDAMLFIGSPEKFIARMADTTSEPSSYISEHVTKEQSCSGDEMADVVDSIMVSQCLMAIAGFTRCALNCKEQELYIVDALRLAAPHLRSKDESIRRCALAASHSAIESYLQLCSESDSMSRARAFQERGALESLSSLGGSKASGVRTNIVLTQSLGELVDWCVSSLQDEADPQGRAFKKAIAQCGVQLFEVMTSQA